MSLYIILIIQENSQGIYLPAVATLISIIFIKQAVVSKVYLVIISINSYYFKHRWPGVSEAHKDVAMDRGGSTWSPGGSNEPPELNQKIIIVIFLFYFSCFDT